MQVFFCIEKIFSDVKDNIKEDKMNKNIVFD